MKKIRIILTALLLILSMTAVGNTEVLYQTAFEDEDLSDWKTIWLSRGYWAVVDGTLQNTETPAQYITLEAITLPDSFVVQFDTRAIVDGGAMCVLAFYLPWAHHYRPGNFQVWNNGMRMTDIGDCVEFQQTLAMPGADPSDWHHFKVKWAFQCMAYRCTGRVADLASPQEKCKE